MTDLQSLIERVEKLTGPDREVDFALMELFDPNPFMIELERGDIAEGDERQFTETHDAWCVIIRHAKGGSANGGFMKIAASVDAALAFAEKLLPGWVLGSIVRAYSAGDDPSPYYCVLVAPGSGGVPGDWSGRIEASADTIPLAIILAALRAKKKEAQNG